MKIPFSSPGVTKKVFSSYDCFNFDFTLVSNQTDKEYAATTAGFLSCVNSVPPDNDISRINLENDDNGGTMLYGLDIGGTKMELVAYDHKHEKAYSKRIDTPADSYETFKSTIHSLVTETDNRFDTRGCIGIGIPGLIEPDSSKALVANIPEANGKNLQADLEFILDRPVKIENDANCFTLSEAIGGAGEGFDSVFGVILGTGCGGGLYLKNKLYAGKNNLAGEWGHTPLPFHAMELGGVDFPILDCGCGLRGCLDNYLSGRGLENIYQHYAGEKRTGKEIVQLYRHHDDHAEHTVNIFSELLACGLGSMTNVLDPGVIVLGGGLSNFDDLYDIVPPLMKKYTLKIGRLPEVRKACFGDAGGARGAAMLNH